MSELPLEAYYDLTQISATAVSPDGDRVAFTATEYDQAADEQVSSLFVAPTDGSREPHRLTRVADAGNPTWDPDGDRLAFVGTREADAERRVGWDGPEEADEEGASDDEVGEDGAAEESEDAGANGDDEPSPQVWLFDLALGGDARQVTDREDGVSDFDWAPDGDRIVVAARDPTDDQRDYLDALEEGGPIETTRLQHKLNGVGWTDDVETYLFVVDVAESADGDARRLDDAHGGGAFQDLSGLEPHWGPEGYVAFTSCRLENPDDTMVRDVYAIDPDAEDPDAVKLTDSDLTCSGPTWRGDGTLGFVGQHPENWSRPSEAFVGAALADGEPDADAAFESVTGSLDRTIARGGGIEWVDDAVMTAIADHSRTRLVRATTDGDVDRLFESQGDERALAGVDVSAGGETVGLLLSDPGEGTDVYAVDTEELIAGVDGDVDAYDPTADAGRSFPAEPESLVRVSAANDELVSSYAMPEVERVSWESDGWTLDGVVYHDPAVDPTDGENPLVVAIHGGPISYDEPVFAFSHAALTSRGYVVFRPNYRGGSSRGRAFSEELRGAWGTAEVDDIAAGVASLVDRGWADPDRVFGYGFSYGGIAQGYLVTQEPDLFAAAAPEHGIYDLRSAFGTDDTHIWIEHEYGLPWENPEAFDASTAVLDAGNIETPLLVVAGGKDHRCPSTQSEQLYVSAKKTGVDAKLVVYPEEHHNIGDPDRAIHRLESITEWYERHDPAVEDGDDEAEGDEAESDEAGADDGGSDAE